MEFLKKILGPTDGWNRIVGIGIVLAVGVGKAFGVDLEAHASQALGMIGLSGDWLAQMGVKASPAELMLGAYLLAGAARGVYKNRKTAPKGGALKVAKAAVVVLAVLALCSAPAFAADQMPETYMGTVSATSTNTAVAFGFSAFDVVIINDGAYSVYIDLEDTTATTSNIKINAGETLKVHRVEKGSSSGSWVGLTGVGIICASGQTASVRVIATRSQE